MSDTPYRTPTNRRPRNAADVAAWAHDSREFFYNLTDWLHEFRRFHSRAELARRVADAPVPCRDRFTGGDVADALLASHIDHLCESANIAAPGWTASVPPLVKPWFQGDGDPREKIEALRFAPAAFRARNVFFVPEPVLKLASGRPPVDEFIKRQKSADRQRRYRQNLLRAAGRIRT